MKTIITTVILATGMFSLNVQADLLCNNSNDLTSKIEAERAYLYSALNPGPVRYEDGNGSRVITPAQKSILLKIKNLEVINANLSAYCAPESRMSL